MKVSACAGKEEVAVVYIVDFGSNRLVECVESVQPPLSRETKWVLLISTLFGCPVRCRMCDAGGAYKGALSKEEIFAQIEFLVQRRFPDGIIPSRQFKIQFARMGEPALNPCVPEVLEELPRRFKAPGLMPSLSTVAPAGQDGFFERLREVKQALYDGGRFQFQFSLHTTDSLLRDRIIPAKKWDFATMAAYGDKFYAPGDRKLVLNFALATGMPVEPGVLLNHFNPDKFLIKITPLNPTLAAAKNRLSSRLNPHEPPGANPLVESLRAAGYQVILSLGQEEENRIGSNCGQYLRAFLGGGHKIEGGYTYPLYIGSDLANGLNSQ